MSAGQAIADLSLERLARIDQRIDAHEGEALRDRWEFGQQMLADREGKAHLPNGYLTELMERTGKSRGELGFRVRFAERYPTEAEMCNALHIYDSWFEITQRGLRRAAASSDDASQDSKWLPDEVALRKRLRSGETVVVNMRAETHGRLWKWAEQTNLAVRIDRQSIWGNPFLLPDDGTRDEVCDNYATAYWPHKPSLHKQTLTLRGKALGCWCAPDRCHGDYLKAKADA